MIIDVFITVPSFFLLCILEFLCEAWDGSQQVLRHKQTFKNKLLTVLKIMYEFIRKETKSSRRD